MSRLLRSLTNNHQIFYYPPLTCQQTSVICNRDTPNSVSLANLTSQLLQLTHWEEGPTIGNWSTSTDTFHSDFSVGIDHQTSPVIHHKCITGHINKIIFSTCQHYSSKTECGYVIITYKTKWSCSVDSSYRDWTKWYW